MDYNWSTNYIPCISIYWIIWCLTCTFRFRPCGVPTHSLSFIWESIRTHSFSTNRSSKFCHILPFEEICLIYKFMFDLKFSWFSGFVNTIDGLFPFYDFDIRINSYIGTQLCILIEKHFFRKYINTIICFQGNFYMSIFKANFSQRSLRTILYSSLQKIT